MQINMLILFIEDEITEHIYKHMSYNRKNEWTPGQKIIYMYYYTVYRTHIELHNITAI